MTGPARADLTRPRDLGALLSDSLALYRANLGTFLTIALVVVVPVNVIVLGVGLGELSGGYRPNAGIGTKLPPASAVVPVLVQVLLVAPLVAVMTLHALLELSAGRRPGVRESIQAGLDGFAPVFWPVLIVLLCELLTAITIVIPLLLFMRLYVLPQVVVMERVRGVDALRAAWERTRGSGWRTAGLVLVVQFVLRVVGQLLATPLAAAARSADSQALSLAATTLGQTLVAAPIGIFAALLYFDLGVRRRQVRAA